MAAYFPLSLIHKKIEELQHALFFPVNDSILKMPTCVITVIRVDEIGQVWFAIPSPAQDIDEFDKSFHAKLDFFKKGKDFFLKLLGKAFIVTDPEEINTADIEESVKERARKKEIVLIKVKISHADYFEKPVIAATAHHSMFKNIFSYIYRLIFHPQHEYRLPAFKELPALDQ